MQAHGPRLFGVELDSIDVAFFEDGRVGMQVGASGRSEFIYRRVIAMREVSERSIFKLRKKLGWPGFFKGVPAHVRNARVANKTPYAARKKSQAAARWRFLAAFKQTLQTDTNAKERHARLDSFEKNVAQAQTVDRLHHLAEMTYAREDNFLRTADCSRVAGNGEIGTEFLERVLHRPDVARAVVDDGSHSKPLVEGS